METSCSSGNCNMKFCCKNCLFEHQIELHKNGIRKKTSPEKQNNIYNEINKNKSNKNKSIYIKQGVYSKDPLFSSKNDPKFDKNNFEFIKLETRNLSLGTGAFGEVFLAKNKIDGNFYAIKQMQKQRIKEFTSSTSMEIALREINIHRRLLHDNIVCLYSYYEDEKAYYLVILYINYI